MKLLNGVHHVAIVTSDLDRLLHFYRTVFDAPSVLDMTEDDRRDALIDVGGGCLLQAFQVANGQGRPDQPMFQQRRLDHIAFAAPTRKAFLELRRRVMQAGASDGRVRDSGIIWSLRFRDPDGREGEVSWVKPDIPLSAARPRGESEIVAADQLA